MTIEWGSSGFLTAAGKKLEYACYGPAPDQAMTLVLLHEGLGCVALWREFPEKLAEATGLGVFVYSRAGYGQSDPVDLPRPIDYMTQEAVHSLPEVLNAVGVCSTVLVGHSDGATIAAIYGGSVSDMRVRGLVLMAPHFFSEPEGLAAIAEAKEAFTSSGLRDRLAKYHSDPDNAFWGWNGAWLDPRFEDWNVADVIDYFRIPTLAIQGADDQYGTLAQIDEIETRSYAPVDIEILKGAKHSPHLEAPESTLAAVTEFCTRLQRIEAAEAK